MLRKPPMSPKKNMLIWAGILILVLLLGIFTMDNGPNGHPKGAVSVRVIHKISVPDQHLASYSAMKNGTRFEKSLGLSYQEKTSF